MKVLKVLLILVAVSGFSAFAADDFSDQNAEGATKYSDESITDNECWRCKKNAMQGQDTYMNAHADRVNYVKKILGTSEKSDTKSGKSTEGTQ